jgi:hypothetical protein
MLRLLERLGRKFALCDFTGNVIAYRYVLLMGETPGGSDDFWPNVYLQHHLDPRGLDGSSGMVTVHHHPWSAVAFIMRGGYTEVRGRDRKRRRAGRGYFIPYTQTHAVVETEPGTWSLFAHWFKKTEWEFMLEPCVDICPRCAEEFGVCEKATRTVRLDDMVEVKANTRKQSWNRVTPEFERKLARRQAAIKKMGIQPVQFDPMKLVKGERP